MPKTINLPGLIDVHTHLREPGATHKEDFATGTKAAAHGGYTAILDMPNNPIPTISEEALEQKIKLATGRIYSDVGFHFGATPTNSDYFQAVKDKVFGLKVYMNHTTGDLLMEDMDALEKVFASWIKGKPILVHAEGETLRKAINLVKIYQQKLHVCHISLKQEVELIKQAKQDGLDVSCEVSCHHLFLNQADAKDLGPYGMMRPPISSEEDRQALWDNLDVIDMIASDHAPHTRQEKSPVDSSSKETPGKVVNGVPGLETSLPLLLDAVNKGMLTIDRVVELTSTNPRRIFNIPEQSNTEVEVDLDEQYTITSKHLFTKCNWTPFEGRKVTGRVKKVMLRGQVVFDGENVLGPFGKVIFPTNS